MKLYETLAENLQQKIDQGFYLPGSKLPSIRATSQEHGVSISTVQEAYGLLADNGKVEARPKSGYFVCEQAAPQLPQTSQPTPQPRSLPEWHNLLHIIDNYGEDNIFQLSIAVPDFAAPSLNPLLKITAELSRVTTKRLFNYDHVRGATELRNQIARLMIDGGSNISPQDIIVTSGCQEALASSLRAVTEPGDIVIVDSPNFFGSLQAIEMSGVKALEIPTHPETGISLDALAQALKNWPVKACLLTPTNNNPLGYSMPDSLKPELLALLAEYDIPLIEDDIYGDLSYQLPRPRTIKSFDTEGRVILCSSFSKTLAAGLRIGWVCPGRYFDKVMMMKYVSSMSTATLNQLAVAEFIAQGYYEKHLRKMRLNYRQDRDLLIALLGRYMPPGTRISYPQGGYLLWIELPAMIDAVELNRRATLQAISIAPGPLFSATNKYTNFMRINCRNSKDPRMEPAIKTLGEIANQLLIESLQPS